MGEGCVGLAGGQEAYVEEVWNEEVFRAGAAKEEFAVGDAECDLAKIGRSDPVALTMSLPPPWMM